MISLSQKISFTSGYIKKDPEIFKRMLTEKIIEYEARNGSIAETVSLKDIPIEKARCFANSSIPSELREVPFPNVLSNSQFTEALKKLLTEAHAASKEALKLARKRKK